MSSGMLTAIQSSELQPAIFVTATFATGPIYVWTGYGPVTWNGQTWLGIGTLGNITMIEEGATVEAKGITISLSGIDPTLLSDVLTEFLLGAPVTVYVGLFVSGALVATPLVAWAGRMDQPTIDVSAETALISINCENRLIDMNVSVDRRYTSDDAQLFAPGDQGFNWVSGIQEVTVYWGAKPNNSNNI
jgi:hypothetical protein